MKLLSVGENLNFLGNSYVVKEVKITESFVFYGIDLKKNGDLWLIFAGVLEGEQTRPLMGSWID